MKHWKTGDISALEKDLLKSFDEFPQIYEQLLLNRNKKWTIQIENFLTKEKNYMIIVGSAHLIGKDSVIKMLKDKGYSIKQL
jgi:uncharacterized protein YbaP (TraB family)